MKKLLALILAQNLLFSSLPIEPALASETRFHLRPRSAATSLPEELRDMTAQDGGRRERITQKLREFLAESPDAFYLDKEIPDLLQTLSYWRLTPLERRLTRLPRIVDELFNGFDAMKILTLFLRFDRRTEKRLYKLEKKTGGGGYLSLYSITDIFETGGYGLWEMRRSSVAQQEVLEETAPTTEDIAEGRVIPFPSKVRRAKDKDTSRDGGRRMTQAEITETIDVFLSTLGIERRPQEAVYQSPYMTSRALAAKTLLEEGLVKKNEAQLITTYFLFPELDFHGLAVLLGKNAAVIGRRLLWIGASEPNLFERFAQHLRREHPREFQVVVQKALPSVPKQLLVEAINSREFKLGERKVLARLIKEKKKDLSLTKTDRLRLAMLEVRLGIKNRYAPASGRIREVTETAAIFGKGFMYTQQLLHGSPLVFPSFSGAYEEVGRFMHVRFGSDPDYLALQERFPGLSGAQLLRHLLQGKGRWKASPKLTNRGKRFLNNVVDTSLQHLNLLWKGRTGSVELKRRKLEALKARIKDNQRPVFKTARALRVGREQLFKWLDGSSKREVYVRGAYDLIAPSLESGAPTLYQNFLRRFKDRIEWKALRKLISRRLNRSDPLLPREREWLLQRFAEMRKSFQYTDDPIPVMDGNFFAMVINGNTSAQILESLGVSARRLKRRLQMLWREERVPLLPLVEETVQARRLPKGSEADFWIIRFAAGHPLLWGQLSSKVHIGFIQALAEEVGRQPSELEFKQYKSTPVERFGRRTLYPLYQHNQKIKQKSTQWPSTSVLAFMNQRYRLEELRTVQDGGRNRYPGDAKVGELVETDQANTYTIADKSGVSQPTAAAWLRRWARGHPERQKRVDQLRAERRSSALRRRWEERGLRPTDAEMEALLAKYGGDAYAIARLRHVSTTSVYRWIKRFVRNDPDSPSRALLVRRARAWRRWLQGIHRVFERSYQGKGEEAYYGQTIPALLKRIEDPIHASVLLKIILRRGLDLSLSKIEGYFSQTVPSLLQKKPSVLRTAGTFEKALQQTISVQDGGRRGQERFLKERKAYLLLGNQI